MRKTSAELKLQARRALAGHYGTACGGILLTFLFMFCVTAVLMAAWAMMEAVLAFTAVRLAFGIGAGVCFFVGSCLGMLIFMTGEVKICLRICTEGESDLGDLLFGLKGPLLRFCGLWLIFYIGVALVQGTLTALMRVWMMAAVIMAHPVLMVPMILINILLMCVVLLASMRWLINIIALTDHPEMTIGECLRYGGELMRGNYGRLLRLWPGFIGMMLLGYMSSIGFIWITPYLLSVMICFYLDLKEERFPARPPEPERIDIYSWGEPF